MIPEFVGSMIRMMLVKFMLNDMPHAAGITGSYEPKPKYIPPKEKYLLVKRTKRGSRVTIQREGTLAKIEVANMEDSIDITDLLNASGIKFSTESNISKTAWEGAPAHMRTSRGPASVRSNTYPGLTFEFDYSDLERVMQDQILQPIMLVE